MNATPHNLMLDPTTGLLARPPRGGPQDLFYKRAYTAWFPHIVRGEGIYLWDSEGNRYLDAIAGAAVSNLGQGNSRVIEAAARQMRELTFTYVRYARHRPNLDLAAKLSALTGPGFERCLFISGGSEANDMAIKLLRQRAVAFGQATRTRIISLMPSFHGNTLGTIAVTGDDDMKPLYAPLVQFSEKIAAPMSYRLPAGMTPVERARQAVQELDAAILRLGPENVLGFIMEPIGGVATGANVPPIEFHRGVREVCTRHGVGLIYDEVMTAFRTGVVLQGQREPGIRPDIAVMAKGIGAGYTPLAAVCASAQMIDELADRTGFNASHTYNANPVSCAIGCAVLDETVERDLVGNAARTGGYLKQRLKEIAERCPLIGDVRGEGLLLGIEFVTDKARKTPFPSAIYVSDICRAIGLRNGLILYARRQSGGEYGEWCMLSPPLIITREQVDELLEKLEATLTEVVAEVRRRGIALA